MVGFAGSAAAERPIEEFGDRPGPLVVTVATVATVAPELLPAAAPDRQPLAAPATKAAAIAAIIARNAQRRTTTDPPAPACRNARSAGRFLGVGLGQPPGHE